MPHNHPNKIPEYFIISENKFILKYTLSNSKRDAINKLKIQNKMTLLSWSDLKERGFALHTVTITGITDVEETRI